LGFGFVRFSGPFTVRLAFCVFQSLGRRFPVCLRSRQGDNGRSRVNSVQFSRVLMPQPIPLVIHCFFIFYTRETHEVYVYIRLLLVYCFESIRGWRRMEPDGLWTAVGACRRYDGGLDVSLALMGCTGETCTPQFLIIRPYIPAVCIFKT